VLAIGIALQRRGRPGVAVAVVLVPAALALPGVIHRDRHELHADRKLTDLQAELVVPGAIKPLRNVSLALGAQHLIPVDAEYRWILGGRFTHGGAENLRARYLNTTDWLEQFLAPRVPVDGTAEWGIVLDATPASLGVRPRQAWRFGLDWVVRL
jgi:hypothetical protein